MMEGILYIGRNMNESIPQCCPILEGVKFIGRNRNGFLLLKKGMRSQKGNAYRQRKQSKT
jgi:hypothetical protein